MKNKLDDYTSTKHKIKFLWESIKELIGLENELKQQIEGLQKDIQILEKQVQS